MNVREFLNLGPSSESGVWLLPVHAGICGGRDSIYGGCALAAAIEAVEAEVERPVIWATCQFLRPAFVDSVVRLEVTVSAAGRAVSHVRVIGSVDGQELFICLLSAGERNHPATGIHAVMPDVPGPEGMPPRYILGGNRGGIRESLIERAVTDDPDGIMQSDDGRSAVWITLPGGVPAGASAMALIGDEVSTGTSAVVHPDTQAPSIDNTLRMVSLSESPWVLADIEVRAMARGFAHGIVNLWTPDGQLLAIAEQTGALRTRGT
jgi:acyl-CoA thioesterase-2